MGPSLEEVLRWFQYQKPTDDQIRRIEALRAEYGVVARAVFTHMQPSADRTAACRQLHESLMTALKGIVMEQAPPEG